MLWCDMQGRGLQGRVVGGGGGGPIQISREAMHMLNLPALKRLPASHVVIVIPIYNKKAHCREMWY